MAHLALFGHLLGALSFVAGIILVGAAFETARVRESPAEIAVLLGLARVGVALVGVGALLILGFGLWLVHLDGLRYTTGWVLAAIVLYLVSLGLGALGGRTPKQARRRATTLAGQRAPADAELRALLDDPRSRAVNYLSALLVVAILVLMVFKP